MMAMDCSSVRTHMLSARRGLLPAEQVELVRAHLAGCDACRQADVADAELTRALGRLPRASAPESLEQRLEAQWLPAKRRPALRFAKGAASITALAAMAAGAMLIVRSERADAMVVEAVNDHMRVLYSEHPIEIESGGIHQVKPWFAGKVDFAPVIAFSGDAEFPLKGGSLAYFVDRKAAAFVFSRRLHTVTLLVFPAHDLPWPRVPVVPIGHARATEETTRGFHTLLWRDGDLGYALVSDLDRDELKLLGSKIVGP
jgi:anti-sigma factor RsiW